MQVNNLKTQKGFTLVEIAIVLVIIGLLLGGVLKGQELIENAKIKSIAKDMENMAAGYYSYQDRKSEYPSVATNGAFWTDLKTEGFISGEYDAATPANTEGPTHAYNGNYYLTLAAGTPVVLKSGKNYICADNIASDIASSLDIKYDDGLPQSGSWVVVADATPPVDANTTADSSAAYTALIAAGESVSLCREL